MFWAKTRMGWKETNAQEEETKAKTILKYNYY